MAPPKSNKHPVLIRLEASTWQRIMALAAEQNMAPTTYVTTAVENKWGKHGK